MDNDASLIVSIQTEKGECYFWRPRNLQGFVFHTNLWTQAYTLIELPAFRNLTDEIRVYVGNTTSTIYIDNMDVIFEVPK